MGLQPHKFAETYIKKNKRKEEKKKDNECLSLHCRSGATEKETSDARHTKKGRTG